MSTLLCSIHRQLLHLPDMSPIPHHVLHVSHVTEHLCPHSHQFWLEFLPSRSMTLSHPPSSIEILVLCVSLHLRGGRFPLWCPGAVGSDWHLHAPDLQNFLPGGCDQGMYHRPPGLLLVGIVKNHTLNALVLDWLSFLDVSIDPRIDSLVLQHHSQQILQLGNFTVSLVHLLCPSTIPLFGPLLPSFCLLSTAFFFALFSSSDTEYSAVYSTWYSIETLWHSSESSSRVSHLYKFIRSLFVLDASINDLFIPVFAYILLYSILPHKELRFIFPILPLLTCIAAGMNLSRCIHVDSGNESIVDASIQIKSDHRPDLTLHACEVWYWASRRNAYSLCYLVFMLYISMNNYPGGSALMHFYVYISVLGHVLVSRQGLLTAVSHLHWYLLCWDWNLPLFGR